MAANERLIAVAEKMDKQQLEYAKKDKELRDESEFTHYNIRTMVQQLEKEKEKIKR